MDASTNKAGKKAKRKSRHIIRKLFIFLLIMALLAGGGWIAYQSLKAEYTVTYQPYTASIGTISNALSFNGTLQARHAESYYADSEGTVRTVYAKAGDKVEEGDKLLRLSNGQTVTAGFDGTVNVLELAVGDSVAAGDELCHLVDFTHMKTSIRVDEYDINSVHVGDAIRVTTTANDKTFDSTIRAINHTSSSTGSVAYYTATAYVDVEGEVYPGMQVTVTLPQEEAANVVILKMNAISFDEDNQAFVYVKDENDEVQKKYITTGVSNGSYTEIKEGLQDGDVVYAEVKKETTNGVTSLLGGLFGQNQFMGGAGTMPGGQGGPGGGFSFDPSNMPDFGSGGGFPGGNGGNSGGKGNGNRSNGSGGGRQ
ncbi:MAG: HlyD family efflux transporter periplasmic adaptor subunit [Clostridia bacterium]|nr:HlyD family efflux transporter periplasmic adaptor subunit [Clostridia bacterium]